MASDAVLSLGQGAMELTILLVLVLLLPALVVGSLLASSRPPHRLRDDLKFYSKLL